MSAGALLLVCDFNAHGGTQTQVLEILAGIDREKHRPRLCTLNLDPNLARRVEALGVPVMNLALKGALRLSTISALSRLHDLILAEGVRLIHGFLYQGNLVAAAAARRAGVSYVTSVRNLEIWKRPAQVLLSRWAHSGAAAVTFNSRHVRDLVCRRESIPTARTRVIPNGLAAPPAAAPSGDPFPPGASPRLVCVASLTPKKGLRHLLRAFTLIRERHPAAALLLVGEGPMRAALQAQARASGAGEHIVFAGYRPDARALIAASDLILLSSIEEGMPNVLLEAMAAGVPQVATAVGGTPEATDDGVTGFLVPPGDPVLMAERACRLLADAPLRAGMSGASRARFGRLFSSERLAREHERLYDSVQGVGG